jgi:hypothetical protein
MRTAILLALAVLVSAGCHVSSVTRPDEEQMLATKPMKVPGAEVIWEWVRSELERSDFRLDSERSNLAEGTFESHWVVLPSPQRFEGIRRKAIGKIVENESVPGEFTVLLTVWVQQNADIENPLEPAQGIWEEHEPDSGLAEYLIYRIEQRYGG